MGVGERFDGVEVGGGWELYEAYASRGAGDEVVLGKMVGFHELWAKDIVCLQLMLPWANRSEQCTPTTPLTKNVKLNLRLQHLNR